MGSNESPHSKLRHARLRIAQFQKHLEAVFPLFPDAVPLYDAAQSFLGAVDDLRRLADEVSNPLSSNADAMPSEVRDRIANHLKSFWSSFHDIQTQVKALPKPVIRELQGFSGERAWGSKLNASIQQIGNLWRGTNPRPERTFDTAAEFVLIAQQSATETRRINAANDASAMRQMVRKSVDRIAESNAHWPSRSVTSVPPNVNSTQAPFAGVGGKVIREFAKPSDRIPDATLVSADQLGVFAGVGGKLIRVALKKSNCKPCIESTGKGNPHQWRYCDAVQALRTVKSGKLRSFIWPDSAAEVTQPKDSSKIPAKK